MTDSIIEFKNISKSYHGETLIQSLDLTIKKGEFFTLLGPSGCGKTTLLRLISGFEQPDSGKIFINGQDVTNVPPQDRQVNTVFQSYALFPHMTLFDNIAFGLRCAKLPEDEIKPRVEEALQKVHLQGYAARKPQALSGGQQQRVAIARAIVNRSQVLLLDEPLAALDYHLRKSMQIELKQLQRQLGIAFIFVTHDQEEALSLSDRVAVMHQGQIEQIDTPRILYETPKNLTVAKFIGEVNIFDTKIERCENNSLIVDLEGRRIILEDHEEMSLGPVHVLIRPEDFRVWDEKEVQDQDKSNMLPGIIDEIIYKGSTVDLRVKLDSGKLLNATEFFDEDDDSLIYNLGERVWVSWLAGWEHILPYEHIS